MVVRLEKLKDKLKNKKVIKKGSVTTKFTVKDLLDFNRKAKDKAQAKYKRQYEQLQAKYAKYKKINLEESAKAKPRKEILERSQESMALIEEKIKKLSEKMDEALEFKVGHLLNYFPKLDPKTVPEVLRRMGSYYDDVNKVFDFGDVQIDPNVNYTEQSDVYNEIYKKFNEVEEKPNIQYARAFEAYGLVSCGKDFIRFYNSLDIDLQEKLNTDLKAILEELASRIGEEKVRYLNDKDMSIEKKVEMLKKFKLVNIRPKYEQLLENKKAASQNTQNNSNTQTNPSVQANQNVQKDKYTIAIEEALDKQDELRAEINKVIEERNKKIKSKSEEASVFGASTYDIDVNVKDYNDKIAQLEAELELARQEERKVFDERKAERAEAARKAREERIAELNRKAKENPKEKSNSGEAKEAREVLSHMQTSTGFYDVSSLTDEEVLETYNAIKNSENEETAERLFEAKVAASEAKTEEKQEDIQSQETAPLDSPVNDTNPDESQMTTSQDSLSNDLKTDDPQVAETPSLTAEQIGDLVAQGYTDDEINNFIANPSQLAQTQPIVQQEYKTR